MTETQQPQAGTLLKKKGADGEGSMFQKQITNLILLTNAPSARLRPGVARLQDPLLCPTVPTARREPSSQKGAVIRARVKKALLEMICYKDTSYQGDCHGLSQLSAVHKLEPQNREEGAGVQKKSSRQESHEAEQLWDGLE